MSKAWKLLSEQDAETREGVAFSWFMIWTVFYIYNVINNGAATYKADELMPATSGLQVQTAVMWLLALATVFSGLSAAGGIYLNLFKLMKLVGSPEFHYRFSPRCGADNVHSFDRVLPRNKNIPTADIQQAANERAGSFQKILRVYEFRSMGVSALVLIENIIQTLVLFIQFVCVPAAAGYAQVLHGFQACCLVNYIFILGSSLRYITSHESWALKCKCVYPRVWYRRVLCVQAHAQVIASFVGLLLVIISMSRSYGNCGLI